MEARWKEVARSGPTRRSTACADRRSRSRSHTRHTVGAGAAVRVAVTPLLPSCPHRHPPAVGRRPDIASTQISKNHPAPWANFPGSGGRMAKTVTVQSEIRESESGIRNGECTFSQLWYQRRSLVQVTLHAMFSPIVPSFFRIFFIKKWKSSPFSAVHRLLSFPTSLPWLFEPGVEHHPAISPGQNRAADMG